MSLILEVMCQPTKALDEIPALSNVTIPPLPILQRCLSEHPMHRNHRHPEPQCGEVGRDLLSGQVWCLQRWRPHNPSWATRVWPPSQYKRAFLDFNLELFQFLSTVSCLSNEYFYTFLHPPELPSLQPEKSQLSQPLLTRNMLQALFNFFN